MKKNGQKLKWNIIVMTILVLLLTFACNNAVTAAKDVSISTIDWSLHNIAPDIDMNSGSNRLFIRFELNFSENNIDSSEVRSLKITDPTGLYWIFSNQQEINEKMNVDYCSIDTGYLYSTDPVNVLSLGVYSFEVLLHNGYKATSTLLVPAPNKSSTDGKSYVFTEDYTNPSNSYVQIAKRPLNTSAVINAIKSKITIKFSINDSQVYNGLIYFYDSSNKYIGYSKYFRDFTSGDVSSFINNNSVLNLDGTENIAIIESGSLEYMTDGYSIGDVSSIRLAVTDGLQYENTSNTYDTESISSLINVISE